jgi:hypothetical protein
MRCRCELWAVFGRIAFFSPSRLRSARDDTLFSFRTGGLLAPAGVMVTSPNKNDRLAPARLDREE